MGEGARDYEELRAWQACNRLKIAIYALIRTSSIARDRKLREQLEDSAASAPTNVAEAFGRFSPPDSARLAVIAKASLAESKNHLRDAVDRGHITDEARRPLHELAEAAIAQVTGYVTYLQSDEARENVRRIRERQSRRRRSEKKKRGRKQ
jgi:four helix bundle protein